MTRSTVQDYLRRAAAKGLSYEQLSQLSDSEAQALLGKGQRQSTTVEEVIDFTQVHQELQCKGITLMLLWQEGLDSAQWQCGYITARPRKPRDKSKVEKAVQEVERQILAPLRHQRFSNFGQLNRAIKAQLKGLND